MGRLALLFTAGLLLLGCRPRPEEPRPNRSFTFPPAGYEVLDLSYPYDETTIYWPTAEGFQLRIDHRGYTEAGYYYEANTFCTAEHGGTHLDAPVHFAEGKWSVDEIPLKQFMGAAVVIDVSEKALANRDYQVQIADFQAWEAQHGPIPQEAIILLRTGYGQFWPDRIRYMGTDERGPEAVAKLHFPGLHPEAARWLLENRRPKAVGIDTPSIDYGQSTRFETHQVLFAANVPAFENVASLDRLPARGAFVIALPMKIRRGSGGPLRIVALVPTRTEAP